MLDYNERDVDLSFAVRPSVGTVQTLSVFHYYRGTSVGACAGLELLQSQARDVRPCQCSSDLARFSLLRSPRARHLFPGSDQGQYKVRRKDVSSRIAEQLSGKSSGHRAALRSRRRCGFAFPPFDARFDGFGIRRNRSDLGLFRSRFLRFDWAGIGNRHGRGRGSDQSGLRRNLGRICPSFLRRGHRCV